MRLEKIKLAGFKSFVDPTTVSFPSNLVGIVGPNGCGKSNVIDAVRWVMGESSAKMLRGESMADVIFNGSTSRKPVGTATIELVFDNSDGGAGGQYASYNTISVKRQVSRDGQSNYFLNGVRCRRRDITDLFLGTGLGPRSYSIIEQGMISRVIEARPEELRVYLEEAAGISKYKERRRETENRISHTRENLDRLNDLMEEIGKHLQKLEKQAKTAEKFKELKQQERRTRAELVMLQCRAMETEAERRERDLAETRNVLEKQTADQRRIEATIEQLRENHVDAQDKHNEVQGQYYAVGGDIARTEQSIQHQKSVQSTQTQDLSQIEDSLAEMASHVRQDEHHLEQLKSQLAELEPQAETLKRDDAAGSEQLNRAESEMREWEQTWEAFNQQAAKPAETAQVERTRINHMEQREKSLLDRKQRLEEERTRLDDTGLSEQIGELKQQLERKSGEVTEGEGQMTAEREKITRLREQNRERVSSLDQLRSQLQSARGRMSSLEALQQAALGKQDKSLSRWLGNNGLDSFPRLAEGLSVEAGWEKALETVLEYELQAVCASDVDLSRVTFADLKEGHVSILDGRTFDEPRGGSSDGTLLGKVTSRHDLSALLDGVLLADSLPDALGRRRSLQAHQSMVTPEGILVGPNWIRYGTAGQGTSGVLERAEEIKQLTEEIQQKTVAIEKLDDALKAGREELVVHEQKLESLRQHMNTLQRSISEVRSGLSSRQARLEHLQGRRKSIDEELIEIVRQLAEGDSETTSARQHLHAALAEMETLATRREALIAERDAFRLNLQNAREASQQVRRQLHDLELRVQSMRSTRDSLLQGIERLDSQSRQLVQRRDTLQEQLQSSQVPLKQHQAELEELLKKRIEVEARLNAARKQLDELDLSLRENEQNRSKAEQAVAETRNEVDRAKTQAQEVTFRLGALQEKLLESGFQQDELLREMDDSATESQWQVQVEELARRIQRLGPINLAAIDEFQEQQERKTYLDAQHKDVTESLETLENAIRKIDRETRTRFKETYDKVNAGLQRMFPKLFGGGHAYLQLTGDDLLDTGVTVMARPPGKRNTSIQLLSGGEKAMSAVALVFSIFELNPAPFCMLDEVDAPLDDANVGRFCRMVGEMSETVQFIFITHNKVTMELANQLSGVTMHEPGVSRLVTVDVEEASQIVGA